MKYYELDGGRCLDEIEADKGWIQEGWNVSYCGECLKVLPGVSSVEVRLRGKHPPFAVSGLGAVLVGLINQRLISRIGEDKFRAQFHVSRVFINEAVSGEYAGYFSRAGVHNLRGDHYSINEECRCGRRKYLALMGKGNPYLLRANLPSSDMVQSNMNRLILRQDLFETIDWGGIPKPKVSEVLIRDKPLDGDESLF